MKKETCLPILVLLLLPIGITAQTSTVKITFKSPPTAGMTYQLPSSPDDTWLVRVPKSYEPGVENPGNLTVGRKADGNSFIFSFSIPPNTTPETRHVSDGIEVSFRPSAVATPAATPALSPAAGGTTPASTSAAPTPQAGGAAPAAPSPVGSNNNTQQTGAAGAASGVSATSQAQAEARLKISAANVDFNVPESPGFTILGLNPQAVIRPTSPRQFATSLLNGVDANGNFQTGVAIDTSPYLLLFGRGVTIQKYRKHYYERLLTRTQLSIATTKGASEEDKSARLGVGAHLTLYDAGDPRLDKELGRCFAAAFDETRRAIRILQPSQADIQAAEEAFKARGDDCRKNWREKNLGKTSWVAGVAGSWLSTTGETKNLMWSGGAFWTAFAYGFEGPDGFDWLEGKAQLIGHFRYRTKEMVPDPKMAGKFFERDSILAGGRFRFGKPTFAGNFEGVFTREKRKGEKMADSNVRLSFGAERKIAENLYFSVSVGGETQRRDGTGNKAFVLTSFKWGPSTQSTQPAN